MFKHLIATAALSMLPFSAVADGLTEPASAATPDPEFYAANNWTGLYAGFVSGFVNSTADSAGTGLFVNQPPTSVDLNGAVAGGQIGYNHQFANGFVLGVVADASWSGVNGTTCIENTGCVPIGVDDSFSIASIDWLVTARAKAGIAVTNDFLIYSTVGLALAGAQASITNVQNAQSPLISDKQTLNGLVVGVGGMYNLSQSVSLGVEYLYADFGRQDFDFTTSGVVGGAAIGSSTDVKSNIVRVSLNYRF